MERLGGSRSRTVFEDECRGGFEMKPESERSTTNRPGSQLRESGEWLDKYSKLVFKVLLETEYL